MCYDSKLLFLTGIITDECKSDVGCSSAVPLSLCHHNTCVCSAGFRSSQGGVVCIESNVIKLQGCI